MSRKSIGTELINQLDESPLDLLVAPSSAQNGTPTTSTISESKVKKTPQKKTQEKEKTLEKERMTVQIKKDTIERVKNAVYWDRLTVAQFVEEALEAALNKLEKQRGEPYQKRKSELKPGRPTK